jgi:hypothetical protein
MARYQIPEDPRQGDKEGPHARRVDKKKRPRSSPPWLWIGLGAIVTVLAIAVAVLWARVLLGDVDEIEEQPTPTITIQTAVPTRPPATPTLAVVEPTSSPQAEGTGEAPPTDEPVEDAQPTPVPSGVIAVGVEVTVAGTGGAGVSLRAGPGTDNARLAIAQDDDVLEIVGGPEQSAEYTWWQVRMADGSEGWVVEDYLQLP